MGRNKKTKKRARGFSIWVFIWMCIAFLWRVLRWLVNFCQLVRSVFESGVSIPTRVSRGFKVLSKILIMSLVTGFMKHGNPVTGPIHFANGLYFEGAINEPFWGLWAIGSNFHNRRWSWEYPMTTPGVITEGSEGKHNGGCQYSFMCDGLPEWPRVLGRFEHHKKAVNHHWGEWLGYEKRWLSYFAFGVLHSTFSWVYDPTDDSALYWTGKTPYWVVDCVPGSTRKIGSHWFCRSKKRGDDLWRYDVWRYDFWFNK